MATLSRPWTPERQTARSNDIGDAARGERLQLDRAPLPAIDRPDATTAILDVTKWFGETSGGVKTYLLEKARWAASHPTVRHTLVIPGPHDAVTVADGTRAYRLRGPRIPGESAYRFLLAPRTLRRIVEHERPDVIEIGSPVFVPRVTALAARRLGVPLVHFHHTSMVAVWRALFNGNLPGRLAHATLGLWARRLDRLVHRTVVASAYAARELEAAGVSRISRVPLGVDLDRFHPGAVPGAIEPCDASASRWTVPSDSSSAALPRRSDSTSSSRRGSTWSVRVALTWYWWVTWRRCQVPPARTLVRREGTRLGRRLRTAARRLQGSDSGCRWPRFMT